MNILAIGIGAGLVSALLFGVVITGSPLAMGLSLVAPLPIFVSALGWDHRTGLVAVLAGGLAMAVALNSTAGIAFSLGWALPAWWLAYLALLGRPRGGQVEWYPIGRLLLWIAGTAALITLVGAVAFGDGSYELYQENLRKAFDSFVRVSSPASPDPVPAPESFAFVFISALPFFFAFNFVLILVLNLWLSAKVVQVSGRLPRPWPFIPAVSLPKLAPLLTGAAILAGFMPAFPGVAGLALGGALLSAFALQGFAVIHDLTRGRPARTALLTGIYAIAFLVSQFVLPLLAVLGAVDVATSPRRRLHNGPPKPPTHRTGT